MNASSEKHSIFDRDLDPNAANHVPLTPLTYLAWAERVYGPRTAVVDGPQSLTYREMASRCRRLASALNRRGIGRGDTVAVMAPNSLALLEAHYGVPMAGAVVNALNVRLGARELAFILDHGEARVLLTDRELSPVIVEALSLMEGPRPLVVDIDPPHVDSGERIGETDYDSLLGEGDPAFDHWLPDDEWDAIALNYTSGTTGNPKGVVYHHRGAQLNAAANVMSFRLGPESVYLWTLPMFHCNGWTYTWAVTCAGGTHICIRRPDPALIFPAIAEHQVTHLCAAPIVLNMLIHAPDEVKRVFDHRVQVATGGAAPPSSVIARMEEMGFALTHLYGLTETYGPSMLCAWQPGLDAMPLEERAGFVARQGVPHQMISDLQVMDPMEMIPVPPDGETVGELMIRGNTVHKGYLKNPAASAEAFGDGWYHTGDLAVVHPDGYVQIKDRAKDVIISGGENISSLEIEEVLYSHPEIIEAAVVAVPHEKWGETPHAVVTPREGSALTAEEVISWCRQNLARYKCPSYVTFGELPKTSTGKIQKYVLREQLCR
ncbi:acyl-CoA synthetase [Fodinicurvata sediminis]|uniref:acyl-CoA synthetase n=1 Tax=Fodinicurvata sediminis TaxID=1121832 RepID=UPI0003B6E908|nr:acyl-CoA synthetase [Fodinicurvata sediminis]